MTLPEHGIEARACTAMLYALHGIPILFRGSDQRLVRRWQRQWASFAVDTLPSTAVPIVLHLAMAPLPPPPETPPVSESALVAYYRRGDHVVVYVPRRGRCDIDLAGYTITGYLTEACIEDHGVFEDIVLMALTPLLRRRGFYTLHAFAAAHDGRAALLVGNIGAGKTTTGLALLMAGYRLCANDSPLLYTGADGCVRVMAYPGLISLYPQSLQWFPALQERLAVIPSEAPAGKIAFALEEVWPHAWAYEARPGAIFFPQVVSGLVASVLRPLDRFEALHRLVTHAVESWDRTTIPGHLQTLRRLVEACPAYALHLAPDVQDLPALITAAMAGETAQEVL